MSTRSIHPTETAFPTAAESSVAAVRRSLEQRVRSGDLDLPLLPRVAGAVLSMARDESSDAPRLANLIQQDLALAGHVMRTANSPGFLPRMRIVSLQQAIARLGMGTITQIAVAQSVKANVFRVPGYEAEVGYMWRHALATGTWASEIARQRRRKVETNFLCGLLHDIGEPVVLQTVSDLAQSSGHQLATSEMTGLVDEYQIPVGVQIATEWDLPDPVKVSIEYCERYRDAPRHGDQVMAIHCADRLATHVLRPDEISEEELRALPVFQHLNLYPDDVDLLLAKRPSVEELVEAMPL